MRILHLASFTGNIGDNASHLGLQRILKRTISRPYKIERLEIRRFYKSYSLPDKLFFDDDFASFVNKFELLIIGGGGFLDFWVENSSTGTTLDISQNVLDLINIPIAIASVGAIPHRDIPEGNVERFKNFLDQLLSRKNTLVAVRNDGSRSTIAHFLGKAYSDAIPEILDNGFFYENEGALFSASNNGYILFNVSADQLSMRNRCIGTIDTDLYESEMKKMFNYIIDSTSYDIVFAPHIFSDYKAIESLAKGFKDYHLRSRVMISPYMQGDRGCDHIFSAYKNSELVLGTRFHTNVCSVAMRKKSIGIAALDRVVNMYQSIGFGNRVVSIDAPFADSLIEKIADLASIRTESESLHYKMAETLKTYSSFFINM